MKMDLTGQKFNHLSVIEIAKKTPRATFWRCKCDCGNETTVSTNGFDKQSYKIMRLSAPEITCKGFEGSAVRTVDSMETRRNSRKPRLVEM